MSNVNNISRPFAASDSEGRSNTNPTPGLNRIPRFNRTTGKKTRGTEAFPQGLLDVNARSTSTFSSGERSPRCGLRAVTAGRGRVLRVAPFGRSAKPCRSEAAPNTVLASRPRLARSLLRRQGTPNEKRRREAAFVRLVAGARNRNIYDLAAIKLRLA